MERLMSRDGLMLAEEGNAITLQKNPREKLTISREDLRWLVFTAGPAALSWAAEERDEWTGAPVPVGTAPALREQPPLDAA